jgi:hypothetical protein
MKGLDPLEEISRTPIGIIPQKLTPKIVEKQRAALGKNGHMIFSEHSDSRSQSFENPKHISQIPSTTEIPKTNTN